eukprot:978712-Amphidinium_carterae.3
MGSCNRPISDCKGGALRAFAAGLPLGFALPLRGNLRRCRASELPASLRNSCCECECSERCRCPGSLVGNRAGAASRGAGMTPRWMRCCARRAWRCRRAKLAISSGCCGVSCSACKVAVHSVAGKKDAPAAWGGCCIAELTCPCRHRIKYPSATAQRWLLASWQTLLG